ncbi:MAG TPA: proton-conducting transporter membrane subunit, partial [Verrucomicrobiae bacterium]|nr:proton-conducting transporter membrane subunit [Verrucomicrobiae bacterium]
MNGVPVISILTVLPFLGGLVLAGFSPKRCRAARGCALAFGVAALGFAAWIWSRFDPALGSLQFEEVHRWIPSLGIQYHVGLDGLGLILVLLTAIVTLMAMLASWNIQDRAPLYFALILFLQAGLFGAFTALNFFHWFIFWELSLIPAFFLIKLWGGPSRTIAATQFFIYTITGSVALLLAFLAIF